MIRPDEIAVTSPPKTSYRKLTDDISGPSIKDVMTGNEEKSGQVSVKEQYEVYSGQIRNELFTEEMLYEKWAELLETLNDRPNLKSSLNRKPILGEENKILLMIDSNIQEELIKNNKPQLVTWLRSQLKNSSIDLITEVLHEPVQKLAYTDNEKFDEMVKKNKNLILLKQRFNLDFDN
jgi:hypothetical protein